MILIRNRSARYSCLDVLDEALVGEVELLCPRGCWSRGFNSGVNADMRFISETQNVFLFVNSPLHPQLVDCLDVPLWIVSGVDQVLDVRALEGDETFHGTINLPLPLQP